MSKPQFDEIFERLRSLETRSQETRQPHPPLQENWAKRNAHWFFPTLAVTVALLVGSGVVALVAGSFVDNRIDAKLAIPLARLSKVEDGVTRIETKLDTFIEFLRPLIAERLRAAASLPPDQIRKKLPQIRDAVALAREQKVTAPEGSLKEIGIRTIDLAATESTISDQAWRTATEVLNYRSSLNVTPQGALAAGPLPHGNTWLYSLPRVPGKSRPLVQFTQAFGVPAKQAARMDQIGTDENESISEGPLFLIVSTGAANIDKQHIRNTVFENVEIHYSGQPLILENVTFVNCTFVFDNSKPGRSLGTQILASSSVNFKTAA